MQLDGNLQIVLKFKLRIFSDMIIAQVMSI
jgi:hypothetical protein